MKIKEIIGYTIALISIGLTILFYMKAQARIEPVYAIKNEPTLIFDSNKSTPKIRMLLKDSIYVEKSVYVTTIVLWNKGNTTIRKEDIRKPFILLPCDSMSILDFEVSKEVDTISNFRLIQLHDKLLIDWDFFDPGFGAEIKIIYSGIENSKITIKGQVLGNTVMEVSRRDEANFVSIMIFFSMAVLSIAVIFFSWMKSIKINRVKKNLSTLIATTIGMPLFLYIIYLTSIKDFIIGIKLPL